MFFSSLFFSFHPHFLRCPQQKLITTTFRLQHRTWLCFQSVFHILDQSIKIENKKRKRFFRLGYFNFTNIFAKKHFHCETLISHQKTTSTHKPHTYIGNRENYFLRVEMESISGKRFRYLLRIKDLWQPKNRNIWHLRCVLWWWMSVCILIQWSVPNGIVLKLHAVQSVIINVNRKQNCKSTKNRARKKASAIE